MTDMLCNEYLDLLITNRCAWFFFWINKSICFFISDSECVMAAWSCREPTLTDLESEDFFALPQIGCNEYLNETYTDCMAVHEATCEVRVHHTVCTILTNIHGIEVKFCGLTWINVYRSKVRAGNLLSHQLTSHARGKCS